MKRLILICAIFLVLGLTLSTYGQALSGNYYIGDVGTAPGETDPDYATLKAACDDVMTKGVGGNITFFITSSLTEATNVALAVNTNSYSITFKPYTGVTPTVTYTQAADNAGSSGAFLIGQLNTSGAPLVSTHNITIDGSNTPAGTTRDLTFVSASGTNAYPFRIRGNSDNITIKNCTMTAGLSTIAYGIWINPVFTTPDNFIPDNISVINCSVTAQVASSGTPVHVARSGTTTLAMENLIIQNNDLFARHRGIFLQGLTNVTTIEGNNIEVNQTSTGFMSAAVEGNVIYTSGITNIIGNNFKKNFTSNTTAGSYGIRTIVASGGGSYKIYNNTFNNYSAPYSESKTIEVIGIRCGNTVEAYNNTFVLNNISATTGTLYRAIWVAAGTPTIQNNIIITEEDDFPNYCIYGLPGTCDYNNLYKTGTVNAHIGYSGGNRTTLADWQSATSKDAHSVSKSVTFVSASDLHLSGASIGDNDLAGTPIALVTNDIDGDARHALFPYMGADEIPGSLLRLVSPRPVPMTSSVSNSDAFSANGLLGTNPTAFYVHWDATYLYLGWDGGRTNYSSDLYYAAIDTDPLGTNGTANAIEGVSFVTGGPKPDYYVVYENNSSFYGATADLGNAFEIYGVNEGNWVWISRTDGNDNVSSRVVFSDGPGQVRLRVPWATLNFVPGASAKLGIVMWNNNSSGNYLWGVVPVSVPTEGATPVTLTKFFLFPSTGNDVNPSTDKSESVFPVELSMFKARFVGKNVELNWTTATEQNSNKFVIERKSSDVWVSLAEVNASGNSNSPKEYSFSDKNLADGKYSYRLKMIDNDGTFEYSPVVEVEVEVPNTFALSQNYPNPFNPVTQIRYQLPVNSQVKLMIFSITGELVTTLVDENQPAGNYTVPFDASALASGTYIYRLVAGDFVSTKKMVVLK